MEERVYENLVMRYTASWNAPPRGCRRVTGCGLPPSLPTGKPTNAEFPTSASTPAVSIMSARAAARRRAEAAGGRSRRAAACSAPPAAAPPASAAAAPAQAAAKKPPPRRSGRGTAAPVQLAPVGARHPQLITTSDLFKAAARDAKSAPCHFISSSLPSAASPSRNSRAGSPNGWRPPRRKACRFGTFTSPG